MSLQKAAACSRGKQISIPPIKIDNRKTLKGKVTHKIEQQRYVPEVSADKPVNNWNILPQAFATAAIFAITGRL